LHNSLTDMGTGPSGWTASLGLLLVAVTTVHSQGNFSACTGTDANIYKFTYNELLTQDPHKMDEFSGKVVLIAAVTTFWGETTLSYHQLNDLHDKYGPQGFEVIGFPNNNFGKREPGSGQEIWDCIKYVRPGGGFEPNFQLSKKVDVVGQDADPLFQYLIGACPSPMVQFLRTKDLYFYKEPMTSRDLRWNWEKFLIGKDGVPAYRFESAMQPNQMIPYIEELLAK